MWCGQTPIRLVRACGVRAAASHLPHGLSYALARATFHYVFVRTARAPGFIRLCGRPRPGANALARATHVRSACALARAAFRHVCQEVEWVERSETHRLNVRASDGGFRNASGCDFASPSPAQPTLHPYHFTGARSDTPQSHSTRCRGGRRGGTCGATARRWAGRARCSGSARCSGRCR